MRIRQLFLIPVLAATLIACTTTDSSVRPGVEPDLAEAARINTQLGIEYLRKNQDDLALEKLLKAIEQDDDNPTAHSAIAFLYQRRGEPKLADRHYRKALWRNDEDPFTLNNYGVFLCGEGDWKEAEEMFLDAAKLRTNTVPEDSWANAGSCLREKAPDRAEQYLRNALQIRSNHPNALAQMAALTYNKKDYLRARAFLQRYQASAQDTPQTLLLAIKTERALGDMNSARRFERRLRTEFPEAPEIYQLDKK